MRGILFCFVLERELLLFLAIEEQFFFLYLVWLERVLIFVVLDGRGELCRRDRKSVV